MWFQKLTLVFLSQRTSLRLIPELREAWACLCNEYRKVPGENLSKEEHFRGRNRGRYKFSTNFFLGLKVFFLSKKAPKLDAKFMARTDWCCARHWPETRDESPLAATVISAPLNRCYVFYGCTFTSCLQCFQIFQGFQITKILVQLNE